MNRKQCFHCALRFSRTGERGSKIIPWLAGVSSVTRADKKKLHCTELEAADPGLGMAKNRK